jgi:circadian clock protein KaiC
MGNADLDRIMHGGIFSESSMVILGELGSGKTTLGLSFLAEGARIGQQCIYMGFSETPEQVISRAESLGIPLTKYMDENLMHIMWQPPVELLLDTLSERLLDFLKEKHIIQSRIFIDGIEGFSIATAYRERLPLFTSALLNQLRNAGATTLISRGLTITAGSGEVGGNTLMDNMCDSVIRLRYIRYQERFYRFFNVVKMRESDYDPVSVPFAIGNGGFVLGEMSEEHKMALRTAPVEF